MLLRTAAPRDLPEIAEILNQAVMTRSAGYTEPVTVEERRLWLDSHGPTHPVIVAEVESRVVGWANLSAYRPGRRAFRATAEISYYVHDQYRRRGVASRLVRDLMERCSDLNVQTLVAILLANNDASISLLRKLGFEEWGRLPRIAALGGVEVDHVYYGCRLTE